MTTQYVIQTVPKQTAHVNLAANASALGVSQLLAAVPGAKYRILQVAVVTTAANNVKFQSATNDISALFPLGANGGVVLPFNSHGWFETNINEALNVNLSAATATAIQLQYFVIPTLGIAQGAQGSY
jgi:hypothetical protein